MQASDVVWRVIVGCVRLYVVALTHGISDVPLTPIVEGFVILKKNPDYEES